MLLQKFWKMRDQILASKNATDLFSYYYYCAGFLTVLSSAPLLSYSVFFPHILLLDFLFYLIFFVLGYHLISKMLIFLIQVSLKVGMCRVEVLMKASCQIEWWRIKSNGVFTPGSFGAVVSIKGRKKRVCLGIYEHSNRTHMRDKTFNPEAVCLWCESKQTHQRILL